MIVHDFAIRLPPSGLGVNLVALVERGEKQADRQDCLRADYSNL